MTVDQLYGRGSFAALRAALKFPPYAFGFIESGYYAGARARGDYCLGRKEGGTLKMELQTDCVEITSLWLHGPLRRAGLVTHYADRLLDWCEERAVPMVASVPEPYTQWLFQRTGAVTIRADRLMWVTQGPDQRRLEYVAWKQGQAPEPGWHLELMQHAPPRTGPNGLVPVAA